MTCETCLVSTKDVHCAWNFVTKLDGEQFDWGKIMQTKDGKSEQVS